MLRITALSLFLLSGLNLFSQATFQKGYFIGNDDQRVECFIKVSEWNRTPTEFLYKLTDSSEIVHAVPATVKEFGVGSEYRLISALVNVDISSDDENNPSEMMEPDWFGQRVFLLTLVDGEASLYEYDQTTIHRFFYSCREQHLQQLIHKLYRLKDDNAEVVRTNETFRQQLWTNVKIDGGDIKRLETLNYTKSDLVKYFIDYNSRSGKTFTVQTRKKEAPGFNLRITPGLNYSLLRIVNSYWDKQVFTFPGQVGFRIGLEAELVIPYTHRTVSLLLEPTYQYFSGSSSSMGQELVVNFNTIEFPIGARYNLYLSKNTRLFFNLLYISKYGINFNSGTTLDDGAKKSPDFKQSIAAGVGLGWKWLSAEFRGYTNKIVKVQSNYYYRFDLVIGIRIFGTKPKE